MDIITIGNEIANSISDNVVKTVVANTGSFYIHTNNRKCKLIRIANHKGHKVKPKVWELRRDVMSHRKGTNRIYNDVKRLINDFNNL